MARGFGIFGAFFSIFECQLERLRAKDDSFNSFYSGMFTTMIIASEGKATLSSNSQIFFFSCRTKRSYNDRSRRRFLRYAYAQTYRKYGTLINIIKSLLICLSLVFSCYFVKYCYHWSFVDIFGMFISIIQKKHNVHKESFSFAWGEMRVFFFFSNRRYEHQILY